MIHKVIQMIPYPSLTDLLDELSLTDGANLALACEIPSLTLMFVERFNKVVEECKPLDVYMNQKLPEDIILRELTLSGLKCIPDPLDAFRIACKQGYSRVAKKIFDDYRMIMKNGDHAFFNAVIKTGDQVLASSIIKELRFNDDVEHIAFVLAIYHNKADVAHELLDRFGHKFDRPMLDLDGNNPLSYCGTRSFNEYPEFEVLTNKLIDNYYLFCSPVQVNRLHSTALITFCNINSKKVTIEEFCIKERIAIKMINTFGSDCNPSHVEPTGETALIWACYSGMSNVAKKLLETFGEACLPQQKDDTGRTAMDYAERRGMTEVVKLLKGPKKNFISSLFKRG